MSASRENLLLAADVGGTKTVLAALASESGAVDHLAESVFENRLYSGVEEIVSEFLDEFGLRVDRACFSVAGPVVEGTAELSNLDWELSSVRLQETFGWSAVDLVNDLQATAYAVPYLPTDHIATLQIGEPVATGPRAVIAPGTGLGESYLHSTGHRFVAYASEGGNADFAPANRVQRELLAFLQDRFGHVSYEMVCSGVGIPNLYAFLKETGVAEEPEWLAERLAAAVDPTPVIVNAALADDAPELCRQVLHLFAEILGAEAGNLALRVLPSGGVYVGGGIPPRILPVLRREIFLDAFRAKGRFSEFMLRFPLHVVLEPRAALLGAAQYGLSRTVGTTAIDGL